MSNKKIIITAIAGIALTVSSCKKFLDVNKNPNIAQTATLSTLLPAAQLYLGTAQGVDLEIDGSFFAQFWTQNPGASQYHNLDQYAPGQDGFSYPWSNLYTAAENFYQLYKLADSQKSKQYMAVSLIMQAYTFQLITDGWGSVPFTQALKGQYADGHIVNPKYDSQMVVYNGIIAYIDSANALLNTADLTHPGPDDLVYGGNMAEWQKFSNTLMLRIYMRMSQINAAAAQAGITALYANGASFLGVGDDASIAYGFNASNRNPLYAEEVGLFYVQNLVASSTCIDIMNSNNDPRRYAFYTPAAALSTSTSTVFAGNQQGLYGGAAPNAGSLSTPSAYVGGNALSGASANAPVNLLMSYESLFLQAEAVARGWGTGSDSALFYQAIAANFNFYSNALSATYGGATPYADYIASGGYWTKYPSGSLAQKLPFIITQKWFSMCGNEGFEAWTEWRRTGYPNFFQYSSSSIIGNTFPRRFTYPTSESTVNSSYPGLVPITTPVWWDVL